MRTASTRLVVPFDRDGERLDVFLAGSTTLSRRAVRRAVASGSVWRNGRPIRIQSKTLEAGDVVDLLIRHTDLDVPAVADHPLPAILHEDRWLLVADKPAGVLSQPSATHPDELALDQLVLLGLAARDGVRPFVRLVHRIDRTTSGAVLFARNPQALQPLTRAWSSGHVTRRYLAIVEGHPSEDDLMVEQPIARDQQHHWRFRVDPGGKPARTDLRVMARHENGTSLVECRLLTGRTHQVRVHLAHCGHPVVGDRLYDARSRSAVQRPLLHAARLVLPHPQTGEMLTVESPLPEDMIRFSNGSASG